MLNLPFNLNLLRSLDVLLETRNLTAAARRLGLTQSAMSRQLVVLRAELNDPLLIREGQRYLLTQRASALHEPLKLALAAMESVLDAPLFDPAMCTRQFVLCGSDYLADNMLPELVRKIGPLAPRLRIAFRMWDPGNTVCSATRAWTCCPRSPTSFPTISMADRWARTNPFA